MSVPGYPRSPGRGSLQALSALVAEAIIGLRAPALAGPAALVGSTMLTESTLPLPSQTSTSLSSATEPSTSNEQPRQKIPAEPQDSLPPITVDSGDVEAEHVETWALVQDGDGEAFGKLYDRYVDQIFRFIFYRVNDRALAEDFTSETFLRALRRISTINYQGRDIGAWFMTIARNIVFDHTKSARFRLELTMGEAVETTDTEASPETVVLAHLTNTRLLAAVNQLGEEQKECIVLRFLHGFSVAETAQAMGKNEGAIKALQYRAVRALARLLPDGFQP
jgi:RNA polymerase sigma-70 factor (TIGR02952 family)